MDHQKSARKFEHLMEKQAAQSQEAAIELEALVLRILNEKLRQLTESEIRASHEQAKELRELATNVEVQGGLDPPLVTSDEHRAIKDWKMSPRAEKKDLRRQREYPYRISEEKPK
jgi:tRNA G37 N-methylase TrmD